MMIEEHEAYAMNDALLQALTACCSPQSPGPCYTRAMKENSAERQGGALREGEDPQGGTGASLNTSPPDIYGPKQ